MKRVCIVGAGPAGLVAAKTLLETQRFSVTVYERADRIGGIWALDRDASASSSGNAFLSPDTPTNISKFSVGFSDFRWDGREWSVEESGSEGTRSETAGGVKQQQQHDEGFVPMFPPAWQVNRYLEAYRAKFIPEGVIRLGMEVVSTVRTAPTASSSGETAVWKVTTRRRQGPSQNQGQEQENANKEEFDHLIIASGFFSQPRPLDRNVQVASTPLNVRAVHSSQFKTLDDILPSRQEQDLTNRTILVYGGGVSSGEAAATIAHQLSNARYSPETGREQKYKNLKIIHVTPHPFYAIPPFVPSSKDASSFLPLDLKLYDLARRPSGPIVGNAGRVSPEVKTMIHNSLQALVGGDQADLGSPALVFAATEPRTTAKVVLSETYAEFVRSGDITVVAGKVTALQNAPDGVTMSASVDGSNGNATTTTTLDNIAAVVYASGYTPSPAVAFLPADVKALLHHDPSSLRLPLLLEGWQTSSRAVPDLAFLGFYEGPYWGMIEMQARVIAHRWLHDLPVVPRPFESEENLLALREAIRHRALDVPQYWFGDYAGYLEEMAEHLHLHRNDGKFAPREGCVSPARYLPQDSSVPTSSPSEANDNRSPSEARLIMHDLHSTWHACLHRGRYLPRAIFRALQGRWKIHRVIDSRLASFPSGTLIGEAHFHPRDPSPDASGQQFDREYLYVEAGTLTLSSNPNVQLAARRRYVYRYSERKDQVSVWFVKPEDDLRVDYLFHDMAFVAPGKGASTGEKMAAAVARADHLCVKDMYTSEYRFPRMKGVALEDGWTNVHVVKGPSKDYTATTVYSRP